MVRQILFRSAPPFPFRIDSEKWRIACIARRAKRRREVCHRIYFRPKAQPQRRTSSYNLLASGDAVYIRHGIAVAENESDSYAAPELTVEDIPVEQSSVPGEFDAVLPDEPKSEELPAPELPVEPEPAVAVDNTEGFENTVADSAEIEPVEQPEETPAAAPVLSGDDWGFTSSPQEKAEEPAVEINESDSDDWGFGTTEASSGSNDNEEGQDWEWVYVEDNDDAGYPVMEAIGDNSYICSGDLYEQPKISEDGPVVYSSAPLEISTAPGIIDDSDETEAVDPYQNSILKD